MTDGVQGTGSGHLVYQMEFAKEHVDRLLSGEKTLTARLGGEFDGVYDGDEMELQTEDGEYIADAIVKRARTLSAVEAYDVLNLHTGHQSYGSVSEFLDAMDSYYPEAFIGEETEIRLIHFEVTDSE